ncbi:hypothetical protein ScPMuIL_013400 [Solemya velum]
MACSDGGEITSTFFNKHNYLDEVSPVSVVDTEQAERSNSSVADDQCEINILSEITRRENDYPVECKFRCSLGSTIGETSELSEKALTDTIHGIEVPMSSDQHNKVGIFNTSLLYGNATHFEPSGLSSANEVNGESIGPTMDSSTHVNAKPNELPSSGYAIGDDKRGSIDQDSEMFKSVGREVLNNENSKGFTEVCDVEGYAINCHQMSSLVGQTGIGVNNPNGNLVAQKGTEKVHGETEKNSAFEHGEAENYTTFEHRATEKDTMFEHGETERDTAFEYGKAEENTTFEHGKTEKDTRFESGETEGTAFKYTEAEQAEALVYRETGKEIAIEHGKTEQNTIFDHSHEETEKETGFEDGETEKDTAIEGQGLRRSGVDCIVTGRDDDDISDEEEYDFDIIGDIYSVTNGVNELNDDHIPSNNSEEHSSISRTPSVTVGPRGDSCIAEFSDNRSKLIIDTDIDVSSSGDRRILEEQFMSNSSLSTAENGAHEYMRTEPKPADVSQQRTKNTTEHEEAECKHGNSEGDDQNSTDPDVDETIAGMGIVVDSNTKNTENVTLSERYNFFENDVSKNTASAMDTGENITVNVASVDDDSYVDCETIETDAPASVSIGNHGSQGVMPSFEVQLPAPKTSRPKKAKNSSDANLVVTPDGSIKLQVGNFTGDGKTPNIGLHRLMVAPDQSNKLQLYMVPTKCESDQENRVFMVLPSNGIGWEVRPVENGVRSLVPVFANQKTVAEKDGKGNIKLTYTPGIIVPKKQKSEAPGGDGNCGEAWHFPSKATNLFNGVFVPIKKMNPSSTTAVSNAAKFETITSLVRDPSNTTSQQKNFKAVSILKTKPPAVAEHSRIGNVRKNTPYSGAPPTKVISLTKIPGQSNNMFSKGMAEEKRDTLGIKIDSVFSLTSSESETNHIEEESITGDKKKRKSYDSVHDKIKANNCHVVLTKIELDSNKDVFDKDDLKKLDIDRCSSQCRKDFVQVLYASSGETTESLTDDELGELHIDTCTSGCERGHNRKRKIQNLPNPMNKSGIKVQRRAVLVPVSSSPGGRIVLSAPTSATTTTTTSNSSTPVMTGPVLRSLLTGLPNNMTFGDLSNIPHPGQKFVSLPKILGQSAGFKIPLSGQTKTFRLVNSGQRGSPVADPGVAQTAKTTSFVILPSPGSKSATGNSVQSVLAPVSKDKIRPNTVIRLPIPKQLEVFKSGFSTVSALHPPDPQSAVTNKKIACPTVPNTRIQLNQTRLDLTTTTDAPKPPHGTSTTDAPKPSQKFYLIRVEDKNILIPLQNDSLQPRAYLLDSKASGSLKTDANGTITLDPKVLSKIKDMNKTPTATEVQKAQDTFVNIRQQSGIYRISNPNQTPQVNILGQTKIKSEPITKGYGDESKLPGQFPVRVKSEPMNRGYSDEPPVSSAKTLSVSSAKTTSSAVCRAEFGSGTISRHLQNEVSKSIAPIEKLTSEERIRQLKELLKKKEKAIDELRQKKIPMPVDL